MQRHKTVIAMLMRIALIAYSRRNRPIDRIPDRLYKGNKIDGVALANH